MTYRFSPAHDPMDIKEQEYQSAKEVRFSKFTSCIGVLAKNDEIVTGVHLVIWSKDETRFDDAAARETVALLSRYQQVVVIGHTDLWESNLREQYKYLLSLIKGPHIINTNDGVYGGRVHNGTFQTYQNGKYVDV